MRCNICGKENPDNVDFCISCGGTLSGSAKPSISDTEWESDFTGYFRTAWRQFARSPLALLVVLCYSAGLVLTFLNWDADILQLGEILGSAGFWNMTTLSHAKVIMNVLHVIEILPSILMVVGIWLIFTDAWTKSDRPIRLGGLTMISVVQVVNMVVLGILLCLVLIAARGNFLFLLALAGLIMYLSWLQVAVSIAVRNTARDCMPQTRYIKVLAVLQFVAGGANLLRIIGGGTDNELNSALNCVTMILLGVLLLKYKNLMEDLDVKRVEMEAQCGEEPEQEQKESDYIPAWKRVQMEKENSEQ